jgi:hypothetical protein
MSILGLGTKPKTADKKADDKKQDQSSGQRTATNASQNDEAKAILAKMEAKKDAGDCPFC